VWHGLGDWRQRQMAKSRQQPWTDPKKLETLDGVQLFRKADDGTIDHSLLPDRKGPVAQLLENHDLSDAAKKMLANLFENGDKLERRKKNLWSHTIVLFHHLGWPLTTVIDAYNELKEFFTE
jgi:hypothetical protein